MLTSANEFAVTLGLAAEVRDRDQGLLDFLEPDLVQIVTPGPGGGVSPSVTAPVAWIPLVRRWQFWSTLALAGAGLVLGAGMAVAVRKSRELEHNVLMRTRELKTAADVNLEQAEVNRGQAERLQALDRQRRWFLAGAMHEMRTPLAAISAAVGPDPRRAEVGVGATRTTTDLVRDNAARLLDTLDDLAMLAELDLGLRTVRRAPVDLTALVRKAAATVSVASKGTPIRTIPTGTAVVWARLDARATHTIVSNLLENATRHTTEDGEVRVSVETGEDDAVWLMVEDDGPGVAEEDQPVVFERFTQGGSPADVVGRSGIGLALVRELVDLHGGTVDIDPSYPSRFVVRFPEAHIDPPVVKRSIEPLIASSAEADEEVPALVDGKHPLVLIVEDEADIRSLLVRDLQGPFRVAVATDGARALSMVRSLRPDAVLLDVMLPERDGIEVLRVLRQDRAVSDTPVVTLTARSDAEASAYRARADGHVQKPWDVDALVAQLQSHIATRRALRYRVGDTGPTVTDGVEGDDAVFSRRLRSAVAEQLSEPSFKVAALAEAMHMTRQHLHRELTRIHDTTPTDFLRNARLEQAALLLERGVRRVGDVAQRVGYTDASLFTKHFKRRYGVTPSTYGNEAGSS
ncbi:MAG: ATP-binding protein [Bacteroidota bacterium]